MPDPPTPTPTCMNLLQACSTGLAAAEDGLPSGDATAHTRSARRCALLVGLAAARGGPRHAGVGAAATQRCSIMIGSRAPGGCRKAKIRCCGERVMWAGDVVVGLKLVL
jgi:hypothetical protein